MRVVIEFMPSIVVNSSIFYYSSDDSYLHNTIKVKKYSFDGFIWIGNVIWAFGKGGACEFPSMAMKNLINIEYNLSDI